MYVKYRSFGSGPNVLNRKMSNNFALEYGYKQIVTTTHALLFL